MAKTTTAVNYSTLGQSIPYTITATNSGNVTLTNVTVTDANATVGTCTPGLPVASLAAHRLHHLLGHLHRHPGRPQQRLGVTDSATSTGTPPTGPPVTSPPSTAIGHHRPAPALTVMKSVTSTGPYNAVGQTIDLPVRRHQHRQRDARPRSASPTPRPRRPAH